MILIFSTLSSSAAVAKFGPEGKIRTICFGDVIDQYGGFNSFVTIRLDPAIEATLVPSRPDYLGSMENAWRNMRIYMPRTYATMVEGYDVIVTSDADRTVFRTDWIDWLTRAVTQGGLGLEWLGSIQSGNFESWEGTTLAGIAPVEPALDLDISGPFKVRIADPHEPLMGALPWEDSPALSNLNTQTPKDGSQLWATVVHPNDYPLMTFWNTGEGAVLCFASKFPNGVRPWSRDWHYFPQSMVYLTYRTAERDIPQDALLFDQLIFSFFDYSEMNSMIVSLFSFVEKFGGRVDRLYRRLDEVAAVKSEADRAYLQGEYDGCLDLMAEARVAQEEIVETAFGAKDRALLWVYVTEWCVLTSALLVSGLAVWTLMIKRRLYREVGISRLTY
jgi:hypothetical protein